MVKLEMSSKRYNEFKLLQEYYNTISTNIQFSGQELRKMVITSVQPGEGKSTTSINLALTLANSNYKTLLIDADIRNSVMTGVFWSSERYEGLTSYLSGNANLSDVIFKTNVPNLMVLPSGKASPNPTNLLKNNFFNHMIENLGQIFDYVIIDTAPIGLVIDAALIAQKCDASLLVAASESVKKRSLRKAKEQMAKSGAEFLGVVLNKYDTTKDRYDSYGAYGSYGSHEGR